MGRSEDDRNAISAMRAVAHPVRLRILSLLTGSAMSAAEVARELGLTHANASYHLRLLHAAGKVEAAGEERIRGGVARRYRYVLPSPDPDPDPDAGERVRRPGGTGAALHAWATAAHTELLRRTALATDGPASTSDLEAWVDEDTWRRARALLSEASRMLHEAARPADTPGTVPISVTVTAFTLATGSAEEHPR